METNIFYVAGAVSVIYTLVRFLEMRFIVKENKPLKTLVRDALIVYFSVVGGNFVIEQVQPMADGVSGKVAAFTNQPNF